MEIDFGNHLQVRLWSTGIQSPGTIKQFADVHFHIQYSRIRAYHYHVLGKQQKRSRDT
jgi:hypothetical protein